MPSPPACAVPCPFARHLQVSEAEAVARSTFLIDCGSEGSEDEGGSTAEGAGWHNNGRAPGRSTAEGAGWRSNGRAPDGNDRGGAGISAAAASGPLGPANAAVARPQQEPGLGPPLQQEERQLDELMALLQQERAGGLRGNGGCAAQPGQREDAQPLVAVAAVSWGAPAWLCASCCRVGMAGIGSEQAC